MEKRSFLLSCAAFAATFAAGGAWRAMQAAAGQPSDSDAERILRLTRNYAAKFPLISAKELQPIIQQDKRRHLLLSLQSRKEYLAGHVPGAVLLPPEDLADPEKLASFVHRLPKNKTVVLTCSNGHLSCAVMLFLRQMQRDAATLALGMYGWNSAYAGSGVYPGDIGGEITTTPARLEPAQNIAEPTWSGLNDLDLLIEKSHGKFLDEITPEGLQTKPAPLLLCLRRPEDYADGHMPDSINIPGEAFLGGDRVIMQIPREREVVLSCYVGHYSCAAALLLCQLGYKARSLAWGMAGWNDRHIGPTLQTLTNSAGFQVESGPGVLFMET